MSATLTSKFPVAIVTWLPCGFGPRRAYRDRAARRPSVLRMDVGLLGLLACLLLGGCGGNRNTAARADGSQVALHEGLFAMTTLVCSKFMQCGEIGTGLFSDVSQCETDIQAILSDIWTEARCGVHGLLEHEFDTCFSSVKRWDCGDVLLGLGAYPDACSPNIVCQ